MSSGCDGHGVVLGRAAVRCSIVKKLVDVISVCAKRRAATAYEAMDPRASGPCDTMVDLKRNAPRKILIMWPTTIIIVDL